MARKHSSDEEAQIDLTPMLDVTFIMLIFFIVTTSFVKDAGVDVNRPAAVTSNPQTRGNILIAVSGTGMVWMQKKQIGLDGVRPLVEAARAENPESAVVILADRNAPAGLVIRVMDQARMGGVTLISVATEKQN